MTSKSAHVQILKEKIIAVSELEMDEVGHCELLKYLIFLKTNEHIGEIVIQRLFGFQKAMFFPSNHSLRLFALYCGYSSWEDFIDQNV